jgi:hypothetical protein
LIDGLRRRQLVHAEAAGDEFELLTPRVAGYEMTAYVL